MLSELLTAGGNTPFPVHLLPLPFQQVAQPSLICPGSGRELTVSLPGMDQQKTPVWAVQYCPTLVCVCGNNCHDNPEYHMTDATYHDVYPQLQTAPGDTSALLNAFTTADPTDEDVVMINESVVVR